MTDDPLFTLLWHRTAHLLKLHLSDEIGPIEWVLFSVEGLKNLISLSLSIFRQGSKLQLKNILEGENDQTLRY